MFNVKVNLFYYYKNVDNLISQMQNKYNELTHKKVNIIRPKKSTYRDLCLIFESKDDIDVNIVSSIIFTLTNVNYAIGIVNYHI